MWLELRWEQEKPQEKPSMRIRIHFIGSPLDPNPHEPLNIKFFRHATTSYFFYTFLVTYLLSILPTFLNARFLNKLLIPWNWIRIDPNKIPKWSELKRMRIQANAEKLLKTYVKTALKS